MNWSVSPDTQAVLLLTAPMIAGKNREAADLLKPGEYRRLEKHLLGRGRRPADLLAGGLGEALGGNPPGGFQRIDELLQRGGRLAQAAGHWHTRSIWVISRYDEGYPPRYEERLPGAAPLLLYGCGDRSFLDEGGLAVVGPRNADDEALGFARRVGALAARSGRTVVSGAARGVDRAAMTGALEAGGRSIGVVANGLEKQIMTRDCRDWIIEEQLLMISPYDPRSGFARGAAMGRNKLIYNLADAALAVEADPERGGTRAGAVGQLKANEKQPGRMIPIYVRNKPSPGLEALRDEGALVWPDPDTADDLKALLNSAPPDLPPLDAEKTLFDLDEVEKQKPARAEPDASDAPDITGGDVLSAPRPSGAVEDLRALVSYRNELIEAQTSEINGLHAVLSELRPGCRQELESAGLASDKALTRVSRLLTGDKTVQAGIARDRIARIRLLVNCITEIDAWIAKAAEAAGVSHQPGR